MLGRHRGGHRHHGGGRGRGGWGGYYAPYPYAFQETFLTCPPGQTYDTATERCVDDVSGMDGLGCGKDCACGPCKKTNSMGEVSSGKFSTPILLVMGLMVYLVFFRNK